MRINGLINFVLLSSATACLMGIVTRNAQPGNGSELEYIPSKYVLPPDTPETEEQEPLLYDFKDNPGKPAITQPKSKLYLEEPANVSTNVEYDPKSGTYNVKQKMGERDYRPETYMTAKEYQDYVFKKQMREYWRSRVATDQENEKPRQGMIPKLQVNSELFDRIFGGNTVDIKPTGTAELIFGINHNKNLNPSIPQKQQSLTMFDFMMRIQLNLIGKIGDKLKITTNYNTEASFDWENQVKVDYTGYEDEIIKKIEAGNVSLPLNSSLISGSQTLFGFKTELQFGRLRATTVFSQQKGKKTEITVQGGAQLQPINVSGDNYEQNKHFFLAHYFHDKYDSWMSTLPIINTPIVVNKIEVYLLGINGSAEQTRNVVAFQDLGEDTAYVYNGLKKNIVPSTLAISDNRPDSLPRNIANNLYTLMTDSVSGLLRSRNIDQVSNILATAAINNNDSSKQYMNASRDYNIIRNARRLNPSEYTYNSRTGFISLNQQLNNDQALAVSYQYTYGGEVYQVGEFSEQVPDNTQLIICKLLKSQVVNVKNPVWDLMMKNVYVLGAYNLNPTDFRLDVYYNNIETGVDVPYLPSGSVNGKQLIRVLQCDKLSVNGDRHPDGVYDFINGYTISQSNGRAYFSTVEPFGNSLRRQFSAEDFPDAEKYIFQELYDSTKTSASFIQSKNRYRIKGSYRSSSGSEIALNALNIPQGAVVVTANGVALSENTDYQVDYTLGRVKILNEGILSSGATIKVSLESNSLFQLQNKSLMGTRLDFKANRNLTLGGTFLRFSERPLTQKVSFGDEPVSNVVAGLDYAYKTDAPFMTRLLDKLPFFSTKEMSTITTRGEVAKLFPGNAKAISKNGGNSYIDDFEGSIALIDIKGANSWFLASLPTQQPRLFPEANGRSASIVPGINRARLNWYNVDAMFTRDQGSTSPGYYTSEKLFANNMWRQVFETELFPGKTPPNGQQQVLPMLDLTFYPSERGQYNYDVIGMPGISGGINNDGSLKNPESRWGGIMRRLETNDFQAANVEYIQFWLMDPYNEDYNSETDPNFHADDLPSGELYINLGNISEDIVKDGRMVYENGIPGNSEFSRVLEVEENPIANVPKLPPVINAFSQDNGDRPQQDVGYDGMSDDQERVRFDSVIRLMRNGPYSDAAKNAFIDDPSSDRYHFFRGDDYDEQKANTLKRYSRYNNPEGNSPTEDQYNNANPNGGNYPTGATTIPNIEDINRDNTLSEAENYYQYRVRISPQDINQQAVGTNFIVDAFNGDPPTINGISKPVKWYQFKIPISQFENNVGGIEGFNSIRFMRVYMKGFKRPVVLRLARFELVRSDWRRYQYDLKQPGEYIVEDANNTSFDVSAVSLQENSTKVPVNYILPPQIDQQQNVQTTNLVLQNEQALQMRVCDLKDGDSRAIFKNVELDTRMFENIKLNVHGEALNNSGLKDGDVHLFFRVGTDYNNNYYEYEVPLKLTPPGNYAPNSESDRYIVWPAENEVNLKFKDITFVKDDRNKLYGYYSDLGKLSKPHTVAFDGYSITIVGNPNLATVKSIMVGVRNPKDAETNSHCVELWVNELRLTEFKNQGGEAATAQVQAKLADLGMVSLAGTYKTPYWGSVESKIGDRSRETNRNWDVSTSINAGKFLPSDWKVTLPVFYNFGRTVITPLFNPLDPDVYMKDFLSSPHVRSGLKDTVKRQVEDHTERKGFNITNARIDGFKNPGSKPMPWDISNFSTTYAYSEVGRRSVNVEYNIIRQYRGNLQYNYTLRNPYVLKPFAKMKALESKWFTLIREANLQLLPNGFGASFDVNRSYSAMKNRDITSFYGNDIAFVNPTLVNKTFMMNRSYNFRWDLTKNIKFDYTGNNESRIMEPEPTGESWKNQKDLRKQTWDTFWKGSGDTIGKYGENTTFRQQMNLNADIPINKIPILDFVKATYRYGGTYTWNREPFAALDNIGNTIQNTAQHNITGNLNFTTLYNKIPYFKKVNTPAPKARPGDKKPPAAGSRSTKDTTAKQKGSAKELGEIMARFVMMIKSASLTYQLSTGQALPNYIPSTRAFGFDKGLAPGFRFVSGLYDPDIRQKAAEGGWLRKNPMQTTPYNEMQNLTYSYRTNIEPHGSLKIELNGNYSKSRSRTEYMIWDSLPGQNGKFIFNDSPNETGNFNISTFTFFNSFRDGSHPVESDLFKEFRSNRRNVANKLGAENAASAGGSDTVVDGYSLNQQDVLVGAFYDTYTGKAMPGYNTKNIFPKIPLPNWNVTWDGLGKIPLFKKQFKNIIVRHTYRSTYTINGFSNNLLFKGPDQTERMPVAATGGGTRNFVPYYLINSVTLSERFEPLIKFDLQFNKPGWSANVETRRDKTTSLNVTGFQIIETKGQEYIIGLGYLYPKLKIKRIRIQGKVLESNLTVKADISFRRNINVIRQIEDGISQPTGGTNIFTLRSSADYQITQAVTLRLFYDWIRTTPQTSASFPTANINAGFSLRINFQ